MITVDGGSSRVVGVGDLEVAIGERRARIECLILEKMIRGYPLLLGVDAIREFGGVRIGLNGDVRFGPMSSLNESTSFVAAMEEDGMAPDMVVEDTDFRAVFLNGAWSVRWKWSRNPELGRRATACYEIPAEIRDKFDSEVERWIQNGVLEPVPEAERPTDCPVIPLLAVYQKTKKKTRPVLDFRELNKYVSSHTGDSVACDETLRKWRQKGERLVVVDLKDAYLQLKVDRDLWKYQIVKYAGQYYFLTRLGFGLNCAPRIMSKVIDKVLSLDERIDAATDHYVDDIILDESVVSTEEVVAHLTKHGLCVKEPEVLASARVLGLQMVEEDGRLRWRRGNSLEDPDWSLRMTRRQLFSLAGQLVGHYPKAGWLRIACSFVKRHSRGQGWEDDIGDDSLAMIREVVERVKCEDPVGGEWRVDAASGVRIWCDASSIALGCAVEVGDDVVEDAAWLRSKDDGTHINVAELDAVLRGVNLAVKWGFKTFVIMTDSATVKGWITSILTGDRRVKTHGIAEMIVRRRLSIVQDLVAEYGLEVTIELIPSEKNKADALTRVSKRWIERTKATEYCLHGSDEAGDESLEQIKEVHERHHFGVNRTLFAARKAGLLHISKEDVGRVIRQCEACQTIDPSPVRWTKGCLSVPEPWKRLAIDVTHYGGRCYLTMIDCGPSRFAIWRRIPTESSMAVCTVLRQIFRERGPPQELLSDNGAALRSHEISQLCEEWSVRQIFRAAHRPSGNGIVERHHRTVKAAAARGRLEPEDVVFWYNALPMVGVDSATIPAEQTYTYSWRIPRSFSARTEQSNRLTQFAVGDEVVVKPANARCTSRWRPGIVTRVTASNVEVDGIPRHVADIRRWSTSAARSEPKVEWRVLDELSGGGGGGSGPNDPVSSSSEDEESVGRRGAPSPAPRPRRQRRRPVWLRDYDTSTSDSYDDGIL